MSESADLVVVGAIAGAFGVRGEVRIKPFTADPAAIRAYSPFTDEEGRVILTVTAWRSVKNGFAARADEVRDREAAEALKSTRLHVPRTRLPDLEEDEFYHTDLIGLAVEDLAGQALGAVRAVHNFGGADLLEIWRTPGVRATWYLPFTRDAAPHVDLNAGTIIADPPDGLIPDGGSDEPKPAPDEA